MLWGYHISGVSRTVVVNARAETAGEKPSFREGWAAHRCVIPASWYYEWEHVPSPSGRQKAGDKYAIMHEGRGKSTGFADSTGLRTIIPTL